MRLLKEMFFAAVAGLLSSGAAVSAESSQTSGIPPGRYIGTYTCAQRVIPVLVEIDDSPGGGRTGRFNFGDEKSPAGSYTIAVKDNSAGGFVLSPVGWIERPAGYVMVGVAVKLDGDRLVGRPNHPSCKEFNAAKVEDISRPTSVAQASPSINWPQESTGSERKAIPQEETSKSKVVDRDTTAIGDSFEQTAEKAKAGDADAQFKLGRMYDKGEGVAKNATEAVRWYRLAAEAGNADTQGSTNINAPPEATPLSRPVPGPSVSAINVKKETIVLADGSKWRLTLELGSDLVHPQMISGSYVYNETTVNCKGSLKQVTPGRGNTFELAAILESGKCLKVFYFNLIAGEKKYVTFYGHKLGEGEFTEISNAPLLKVYVTAQSANYLKVLDEQNRREQLAGKNERELTGIKSGMDSNGFDSTANNAAKSSTSQIAPNTALFFSESFDNLLAAGRQKAWDEQKRKAESKYRSAIRSYEKSISPSINYNHIGWLVTKFMQLSTGDPQVPDNLIGNAKYIKGLVDARFVDIGQGASNESFLGSLLRVSTDDRYNTPLGWYDKFWTSPTQSFLECAKLLKNRNCALLSEYFSMQPNQALLGSSEPKLSDEQELSRIKSALYGIHKYVLDKTPVTKLNPEDLSCLTFREEFGSVSERTDCNFVNMGVCLEWNYKTTRTKQLFTKNSCSRSIAISYLCPESGASRYSLSLDAGKEISGNWRDKDPKCLERELRIFGDM